MQDLSLFLMRQPTGTLNTFLAVWSCRSLGNEIGKNHTGKKSACQLMKRKTCFLNIFARLLDAEKELSIWTFLFCSVWYEATGTGTAPDRVITGTVLYGLTHLSVSNKYPSSKLLRYEFIRIQTIALIISGVPEVFDMVMLVRVSWGHQAQGGCLTAVDQHILNHPKLLLGMVINKLTSVARIKINPEIIASGF